MAELVQNNNPITEKQIIVLDSRRVLIIGVSALVLFIIGCMIMFYQPQGYIIFLLILPIITLLGLMINVNRKGYIIDLEEGTLEFPGGAIEANDMSGIFDIKKYFSRKKVYLNEISQIATHYVTNLEMKNSLVLGELPPIMQYIFYPRHHLLVNGMFGTLRFRFFSDGKRDMLFSTISQIDQMGTPIIER